MVAEGSRTPQFRGSGAVLNSLYKEIHWFTGFSLTFMDLKDLIVRVLLDSGVPALLSSHGDRAIRT